MAFSHRIAALAAVVAIPLGIAATSYALTDSPETPKVPPKVELEESPSGPAKPTTEGPTPSDEVVSPPPVTDEPSADDDDDRTGGDSSPDDDDDDHGDRDDG
ncbi:small secreted hydrophilic protein [Streptomyces triticagri]|uniref:Small secreted hydrophilic protein n=1 Tax=Streptomyces triticagri TaxID=2293568 RepID=A0A372LXY3_9ACTN|nr:small secreted hydrophilic protein [Streptomyces triticagri]RFU83512.1 small secreted hydrophilic protein [Streptomyces triticagri]